jgi:hypothetical protein
MLSERNKPVETENNFFAPPAGAIAGSATASPNDPEFRWQGQKTTGDKSAEAAIEARRAALPTLEAFEKWRRSKGMPELTFCALAWAYAQYKGETPGEKAILVPVSEKR